MPEVRRVSRLEQPTAIERFYQRLLQIDRHARQLSLLDDALRLIVEITGARVAYVEMIGAGEQTAFSRSYDLDRRPHETISATVSRDIVAQAIARNRVITLDRRTSERRGAILCIPIPSEVVAGIMWLEGKASFFSDLDRERARWLAGRLAALRFDGAPRRTLHGETRALHDRRVREALLCCHGNISEAARELGVSRSFVHSVLKRGRGRTRHAP